MQAIAFKPIFVTLAARRLSAARSSARKALAGFLGRRDERRQQADDIVAGGNAKQMLGADRLQQFGRREPPP